MKLFCGLDEKCEDLHEIPARVRQRADPLMLENVSHDDDRDECLDGETGSYQYRLQEGEQT